MAYPQFGTTSVHMHALRQTMGDAGWRRWITALAANEPMLLDGNSSVVRMVGAGEIPIGFTDIDDVRAGIRAGLPIADAGIPDDTLIVRNSVGVVAGAPHPEEARQFLAFVRSATVSAQLEAVGAVEGSEPPENVRSLSAEEWRALIRDLDETSNVLAEVFVRN
jgi:iron(III) transport system substrate-binding protein